MGQSAVASVSAIRGSTVRKSALQRAVKEAVDVDEGEFSDEYKDLDFGTRNSTGSQSSSASVLPELINDNHDGDRDRLLGEAPLVLGFTALAGLLCDVTMHLDANYCIGHANGPNSLIESIFRGLELKGASFLDIVTQSDQGRVEQALQDASFNSPALVPAVLLCEEGIGTIPVKLLIIGAVLDGDPLYIVGMRSEDIHGLSVSCSATDGPPGIYSSSDNVPYQSGGSDILPGFMSGPSRDPSLQQFHLQGNSRRPSEQSLASRDVSFAYSASSASSSNFSRLFSRIPSVRLSKRNHSKRMSNMSHTSDRSALSNLSAFSGHGRSSPVKPKGIDVEAQTDEADTKTASTQTDSTHVPTSPDLQRPSPSSYRPPKPSRGTSRSRGSNYSDNEKDRGRRHTSRTVSGSSAAGGSGCDKGKTPSDSVPSSKRSSVESRRGSLTSSCDSQDLVIRHFQATSSSTIHIYIATLVEHVNAHCEASSCCAWHATVRSVVADCNSLLVEEKCRSSSWLPSSGWQCMECFALNDVDADECDICLCDRIASTDNSNSVEGVSAQDEACCT